MMPSEEKIKAKLSKLLELARQGVGGEKDNAQSVLDKLLKKHCLSLEDFDPEFAAVEPCEFSFKNEVERHLLQQVMYFVLQVSTLSVRVARGNSKKICIMATKAQQLEIDLAFSLYREAFKKEQHRLLLAFVHKNRIYGSEQDKDDAENASDSSVLSKEDVAAIVAMMGAINITHVRKALPSAVAT